MLFSMSDTVFSFWRAPLAAFALGVLISPALANEDLVIKQWATSFMAKKLTIDRGTVVQFMNGDPFLHHVYVESPRFSFDSGEQRPGTTFSARFDRPGEYVVMCAIHLKMRLPITVR
jgi:plastocyanin